MATDANDDQVTVRLPAHLVERVDRHRGRMAEAAPGVGIRRSDALRALILLGLESAER